MLALQVPQSGVSGKPGHCDPLLVPLKKRVLKLQRITAFSFKMIFKRVACSQMPSEKVGE